MDNMDRLEIRIPEEIRDYKERYGGFTIRQWVGGVLIALIVIPTYLYLNSIAPGIVASLAVAVITLPIGALFFFPVNGMPAERIVPYIVRYFDAFSRVLCFQTEKEKLVEWEMSKDRKYRRKMRRLKKKEQREILKIERGDAKEENEKLRAARKDINTYYENKRNETIDQILHNKKPMSRKEKRLAKKEARRLRKERKEAGIQSDGELLSYETDLNNELNDDYTTETTRITKTEELVSIEENKQSMSSDQQKEKPEPRAIPSQRMNSKQNKQHPMNKQKNKKHSSQRRKPRQRKKNTPQKQ